MKESNSRPSSAHQQLIASVLVAEIAGYENRPVFEQIDLTSRCRQLIELGIAEISCPDVLHIAGESKVLIVFPGDPVECLRFSGWLENLLEHDNRLKNFPLRVGVNLGAVTLLRNERGEMTATGVGVDDALRIAQSGRIREVLFSRAYYTVLSRATMNDRLLHHRAFISDEHDQSLAVYEIARPDAAQATPSDTPVQAPAISKRARWSAVAAISIAVAGSFTLLDRETNAPIQPTQIANVGPKVGVAIAPKVEAPAQIVITEPEPVMVSNVDVVTAITDQVVFAKPAVQPTRKMADLAHVTVQLAIKPWGEIYVDGKKVGVTPPLNKIKLPPGKRDIVVRNSDFVPFHTTLDVQPESLLQVSHRFDK